jgi:hypothetical protein
MSSQDKEKKCLFCGNEERGQSKKVGNGQICGNCYRDLYKAIEGDYDKHISDKLAMYTDRMREWVKMELNRRIR